MQTFPFVLVEKQGSWYHMTETSLQSLQEFLDFWNDIPFPLGVCPSRLSCLFVCFLLPVVANEQIKIIVNREPKNLNDKGKVLSQACIFCQENLQ